MKYYVFVDSRLPELDLIVVATTDPDLVLQRVEVDVEENGSITDAVKAYIKSH